MGLHLTPILATMLTSFWSSAWGRRIACIAASLLMTLLNPGGAAGVETEQGSEIPAATRLLLIEVESTDEGSVVYLRTDGPVSDPDVFVLDDPHALVLHLPGVDSRDVKGDIRGLGPRLSRVRVLQIEGATQVALEAPDGASLVDRRLIQRTDGMLITLGGGTAVARALASATDGSEEKEPVAGGPIPTVETPPEPRGATRLVSIEVRDTSDGALVRLWADGTLGRPKRFILRDPYRLVIDLRGLEFDGNEDAAEVQGSGIYVDRVRVGENSERVRVVIDAPNEAALVRRRLIPVADGLLVTLGRGETVTRALEELKGAGAASGSEI